MSKRLKKYISKQKDKGNKRVSFFINIELWEFLKEVAKKHKFALNVPYKTYTKKERDLIMY